jgi:hypothetical protein
MATVSVVSQRNSGGGSKETVADVTMDSSYPTGGEVFTAADVKMHKIEYGIASLKAVTGSVNISSAYVEPTTAGFDVKSYNETPAETTNTNSLNNVVIRCTLYGK